MEKGYNSDLRIQGEHYHVQTEDWGAENPFLVSRVYRNGAVVKSLKIPYDEVFTPTPHDLRKAVQTAMQIQHQQILDLLVSGQLF
jgi:hypothetical protein